MVNSCIKVVTKSRKHFIMNSSLLQKTSLSRKRFVWASSVITAFCKNTLHFFSFGIPSKRIEKWSKSQSAQSSNLAVGRILYLFGKSIQYLKYLVLLCYFKRFTNNTKLCVGSRMLIVLAFKSECRSIPSEISTRPRWNVFGYQINIIPNKR